MSFACQINIDRIKRAFTIVS